MFESKVSCPNIDLMLPSQSQLEFCIVSGYSESYFFLSYYCMENNTTLEYVAFVKMIHGREKDLLPF